MQRHTWTYYTSVDNVISINESGNEDMDEWPYTLENWFCNQNLLDIAFGKNMTSCGLRTVDYDPETLKVWLTGIGNRGRLVGARDAYASKKWWQLVSWISGIHMSSALHIFANYSGQWWKVIDWPIKGRWQFGMLDAVSELGGCWQCLVQGGIGRPFMWAR